MCSVWPKCWLPEVRTVTSGVERKRWAAASRKGREITAARLCSPVGKEGVFAGMRWADMADESVHEHTEEGVCGKPRESELAGAALSCRRRGRGPDTGGPPSHARGVGKGELRRLREFGSARSGMSGAKCGRRPGVNGYSCGSGPHLSKGEIRMSRESGSSCSVMSGAESGRRPEIDGQSHGSGPHGVAEGRVATSSGLAEAGSCECPRTPGTGQASVGFPDAC